MELSILEMDSCRGRTCAKLAMILGSSADALCEDLLRVPTSIYMVACLVLMLAWFLGWVVFGVSSGLIHLVLCAALASFVLHFFRGRYPEADLRINR